MKKIITMLTLALLLVTLPVNAFASNFTPSVSQKGAPEVVETTDDSGEIVVAEIKNKDGEVIRNVHKGYLLVTPLSEAAEAPDDIERNLLAAYDQILNAKTLNDLVPGLQNILSDMDISVSAKNLLVQDLFDVSVFGEYKDLLALEENTITVRFELSMDPDVPLVVLHNHEGTDWEVIAPENIVRHEDGDVSITFDDLSPVSFVVEGPESTEPAMTWMGIILLLIGAVALVCGLGVLFFIALRRVQVR